MGAGGAVEGRVEVLCPCCATRLVVDTATGEVLAQHRPKADPSRTFDDAMKKVQAGEQERHAAFERAFSKTQQLDDLLRKKFEEAQKKAAEDVSERVNPLDYD
jgi:hypothetical protein